MARSLSTIVLLVLGVGPLAAQDRWEGVFETDGLTMYVVSFGNNRYQGLFDVGDQRIHFEAKSLWRVGLRGTYAGTDGETVFEAMMIAGTMVLADPYQRYTLSRSADVVPEDVVATVMAGSADGATTHVNADAVLQPQAPAASVPAAPTTYPATFEDPYRGFRFTTPRGWVGSATDVGYSLQSESTSGTVLVLPHDLTSLSALRAEARAGFNEGVGTLRLADELEGFGDLGVSGVFAGTIEGQDVRARMISLLSPHGGGITVLAVGRLSEFGQSHEEAARSIANSIELFEPRAQDAAYEWKERLSGARLTYLYNYYSGASPDGVYVGASEETKIDLCVAGHFYFGSSGSLSVDGAGGRSSAQRGLGVWDVWMTASGPALHLSFHDGSTSDYALTFDDEGKTLLNGQRYFRTYASSPVEDARPACP